MGILGNPVGDTPIQPKKASYYMSVHRCGNLLSSFKKEKTMDEEDIDALCEVANVILDQAMEDDVFLNLFNGKWSKNKIVGFEINALARHHLIDFREE